MTFGFVGRAAGSAGLRGARFQAVFSESSPAGIGWNLWGMLPHLLPQRTTGVDSLPHVIMASMKKVVVCSRRHRRANRATEMRALLRHARPHGGSAAERVKQGRPNDRSAKGA